MKKITKLWQVMMLILLSSSIAFAQTTVQDAGNGPANFKSPFPPNFNAKGELDCPTGSQFSQSADGYSQAGISDIDGGYKIFQNIPAMTEDIHITFWGINAWLDGGAWISCNENPRNFKVEFYIDNGGVPNYTAPAVTFNVRIDGVETGELFSGGYEILRYTFTTDLGTWPPNLVWISVQGNPGTPNNCWFLWVDSGLPGLPSMQLDEATQALEPTNTQQSLCLGGELYRIWGNITYANLAMTPMVHDEVTANMSRITYTDWLGDYLFKWLEPNWYTLRCSPCKDCGGLTMNDVQLMRQYVINQPPGSFLSGIHLKAGDINGDGALLMNDVLAMWQKISSSSPGFSQYWICDEPDVVVPDDKEQDLLCICAGDVDGSYTPPTYCPAGADVEEEYIKSVTVGTLFPDTYDADGIPYHDYTIPPPTTDLVLGGTYPMTVVNGFPYAGNQCTVWIDWDCSFTFDSDEMFTLTSDPIGEFFTGNIIVDPLADLGDAVMRVRLNWTLAPDPCGNALYGEVHDYRVTIVE